MIHFINQKTFKEITEAQRTMDKLLVLLKSKHKDQARCKPYPSPSPEVKFKYDLDYGDYESSLFAIVDEYFDQLKKIEALEFQAETYRKELIKANQ